MRRQGAMSSEVNVSHKEIQRRCCNPYRPGPCPSSADCLHNGEPLITNETEKLAKREVNLTSFVQSGLIELIDAEEEEDLLIAMNPENVTPEHTHLEIDPSLILGIGAAHVPFPEHNASPRVTMGAGMVKQALGFGCTNMKLSPDTRGHLLHYTQKPLTHTQTSELIGSDDRPAGQNFVVAILSFEGDNIEDALIFNKASIERGLGRSHFFRTCRRGRATLSGWPDRQNRSSGRRSHRCPRRLIQEPR